MRGTAFSPLLDGQLNSDLGGFQFCSRGGAVPPGGVGGFLGPLEVPQVAQESNMVFWTALLTVVQVGALVFPFHAHAHAVLPAMACIALDHQPNGLLL